MIAKTLLQQIEGQQINADVRAQNLLAFLNLLDASHLEAELPGVRRGQGKSKSISAYERPLVVI